PVRQRTVQILSLESDPQSLVLLALIVNGTLSPKLHCGIGTGANVKLIFSFGAAVIGPLLWPANVSTMVSVACEQLVANPVTVTGLPGQAAMGAIEQSGVTHGGWRHSTSASQSIAASGEQSPCAVAWAVNLTLVPGVQSDGMVNVAVSWQVAPGARAVQVLEVPPAVIVTSSLAGEVFFTVNVIVTGLPPRSEERRV